MCLKQVHDGQGLILAVSCCLLLIICFLCMFCSSCSVKSQEKLIDILEKDLQVELEIKK